MIGAFDALGDCEIYADNAKKFEVEYPDDYMYAVGTVLRLKHFYMDRKRKGFRYAVFNMSTYAPVTFKQIKDHARYIFKVSRTLNLSDEWHLAQQFRLRQHHHMGFDEQFYVPLCHLQGFQKSMTFSTLTARERKRFIEARRWLEERTPVLVMDLVSSKRMSDLKDEHWVRMLNNFNYASTPPLSNKPVLVPRPIGSTRVPKRTHRGRVPTPNSKR